MKSIIKSKKLRAESIQIRLASPEKIRQWADRLLPNGKIVGQITNSQTVNYKTLRPVKGGIFCERIFGPIKDFECACGRRQDKVPKKFCPDCDVEYTSSRSRRSRLGYIQLISPVTHVWYFRGRINYISNLLNLPRKRVEAVTYCTERLELSETEILTFSFLPPMIGRKGYFKHLPAFFLDTEESTVKVIPNKSIEETISSEKIKNDYGAVNKSKAFLTAPNTPYTPDTSPNIPNGIRGLLPFTSPNIPNGIRGLQIKDLSVSGGEDLSVKGWIRAVNGRKKVSAYASPKILPSTLYVEQKSHFDVITPDISSRDVSSGVMNRVFVGDVKMLEEGVRKNFFNKNFIDRIFKKFSHQRVLPISKKFPWESEKDRNLFRGYTTCSPKEGDIPIPTYFSSCSASENSEINVSNVSLTDIETVRKVLANTGAFAISDRLSELELVVLDQILRGELSETKSEISQLENQVFLLLVDHRRLRRWFARRSKIIRRLILVRDFLASKARPEWMTLSTIPVLPPDLRPIIRLDGDQVAISDLNKLYQKIFFRNKRFRRTNIENACYAQRLLQEGVDALIENGKGGSDPICASNDRPLKSLSDVLKGKKGRFRQNLLGKRVDYSGRSVIVVGPTLKLHQCGLPKEMAVELFQPFLIRHLVNRKIVPTIITAKKFIHDQDPVLWEFLQQVMERHPILLNRAPTLHRLGIQAFQPKLVNGRAILLHPLVCPSFNADFDGDQMAVHVPLIAKARAEAWRLMWSRNNLLSPATGQPIIVPSQDMVLGCSYLTTFNSNSQSISVISQNKCLTSILSKKQRQLASNIAITLDINKKPKFVSAALTSYTYCPPAFMGLGLTSFQDVKRSKKKIYKVHTFLGMLGDVKKDISGIYQHLTPLKRVSKAVQAEGGWLLSHAKQTLLTSPTNTMFEDDASFLPKPPQGANRRFAPWGGKEGTSMSGQNTKTKEPIISDNKLQYFAKQNKDSKILTSPTKIAFFTPSLDDPFFLSKGKKGRKEHTPFLLSSFLPFFPLERSEGSTRSVGGSSDVCDVKMLKGGVSDDRVLRKYGQYFSDFNDLLKAYYQNKIDLHASVWVRKNGLLETEKSLESPLEIRVNSFGQYNEIFSTYQYEYDLNGQKIKQYVRTTPGRVLLNQVIFT